MKFDVHKSIEIISRTPDVLESLLSGLSGDWILNNEGGETWSPYDVVGHLIEGEKSDWLMRMNIILHQKGDLKFKPFDRFAQFNDSKGKTMKMLLDEFRSLRNRNIEELKKADITAEKLELKGIHPVFGEVTLLNLLSTWVVHDLNHIGQIVRVMSKQYATEVGPWVNYLPILTR